MLQFDCPKCKLFLYQFLKHCTIEPGDELICPSCETRLVSQYSYDTEDYNEREPYMFSLDRINLKYF